MKATYIGLPFGTGAESREPDAIAGRGELLEVAEDLLVIRQFVVVARREAEVLLRRGNRAAASKRQPGQSELQSSRLAIV